MINIKTGIIAFQLLVIIILGFWLNKEIKNSPIVSEIIKIDTVTVVQVDTLEIEVEKPIYIKPDIPEPEIVYVNISNSDSLSVNRYDVPIEDSLIVGNIVADVEGNLVDIDLTYTPKFPKYITRTVDNTITKEITNTIRERYVSVGGGVELSGLTSFEILDYNIGIDFTGKSRRKISGQYNISSKSYEIGISFPLDIGFFGL